MSDTFWIVTVLCLKLWCLHLWRAAVNQHKTLQKQEVVSLTSSFRFANRRRDESEKRDGLKGRTRKQQTLQRGWQTRMLNPLMKHVLACHRCVCTITHKH